MTVQGTASTEVVRPGTGAIESVSREGMFVRRWVKSRSQQLVALALISSDILLALAIWQAAFMLQGVWGHGPLSWIAFASMVPYVIVWVGLRAALGLYPGYGLGPIEELRRQTFALFATLAITAVFAFASQVSDSLSRVLLFAWIVGLLLLAPVARYFVKRVMRELGFWGKPVVVLGAREPGAHVLKVLRRERQLGFKPFAVFDNRVSPAGGMLEGVPYGGTLTDAAALAPKCGVDTAIFAMPYTKREHLAKFVASARDSFRHVVIIPDLGGITNSAVVARDFAGTFGVEIRHNLLDPWAQRFKRALDLLGSVLGGLLISPILLAILVLIKLDSPGSAFYGHTRIGVEGKHFRCWKFRTMHVDAERVLEQYFRKNPRSRAEWERSQKLRDDPRITRTGRFLRKTSLDELPQLWNVLRGEMSLTGPRPIVDAEVSKYGTVFELYRRIRPGMSGLWQISGRSSISYTERVAIDSHYVRNWSFWLDLIILARTVKTVVLGRGAF